MKTWHKMRASRGFAALIGLVLAMMPAAQAEVTAKDVQIAARVMSFTNPPFAGTVRLGIVYDPANAASTADEQSLLALLGNGLSVGNVQLVPVPVPIGQLGVTPVDVLFLTSGLGAKGALAGSQAAAGKLCITTDAAATAAGYCAVAVQSEPKVQITVNTAASGVRFDSVFLLMVNEI